MKSLQGANISSNFGLYKKFGEDVEFSFLWELCPGTNGLTEEHIYASYMHRVRVAIFVSNAECRTLL